MKIENDIETIRTNLINTVTWIRQKDCFDITTKQDIIKNIDKVLVNINKKYPVVIKGKVNMKIPFLNNLSN